MLVALLIEHPYWIVINSIKIDTQGPRPVFWLGHPRPFLLLHLLSHHSCSSNCRETACTHTDVRRRPYGRPGPPACRPVGQRPRVQSCSRACNDGYGPSSGVYLFVYEACNVLEGQKFQPFKGKALTGLICVTAGVALLTGSYILAKRVNSGERLIYRIQDRQMMLPYSMLTVGPTEHGLGMSYRF